MTQKSVAVFKDNLPADANAYDQALAAFAAAANQSGRVFLKMGKDGKWVYGAENIAVTRDDLWAVNPRAIRFGVIGWCNGALVGEEMHLLGQGTVDKSKLEPIISNKPDDGWKDQFSIEMQSIANPNLQVTWASGTRGGISAMRLLVAELVKHSGQFPVVRCDTSSYSHDKYGKIYTPVLEVVRWEGNEPRRELV